MFTYLIDASALVIALLRPPQSALFAARKRMLKLLALKQGRKGPAIYVPNFCLAECSKALANLTLVGGSERAKRNYHEHVELMLDMVSSKRRGMVQTYKLKRAHLVDIEDVFKADHALSDRDESRLSGLDGLVIAMGRALERSHGKTIIVTNDKRLATVCAANAPAFPQAVYIKEQEIPGT